MLTIGEAQSTDVMLSEKWEKTPTFPSAAQALSPAQKQSWEPLPQTFHICQERWDTGGHLPQWREHWPWEVWAEGSWASDLNVARFPFFRYKGIK